MKNLLNIFFLFFPFIASAQPSKIDSLLTLLKTDKEDTNKVIHLYNLCNEYRKMGEYDHGLQYGNAALQLAKKIYFPKGIATSYNNIGIIYFYQSNFDNALENYFASLKIREEIGDKQSIAASYNNIAGIYISQGNYDKALENLFSSLKIFQELENKENIAKSYNNIGSIYKDKGNYDKALENYFASLKIKEKFGDKQDIANALNNIGEIYDYQRKYSEAAKNYLAALKIREEMGDKQGIAASYTNIGVTYFNQNKIEEAKKQSLASLNIAKEIGSKEIIVADYSLLSHCDSATGNWKGAYEYHKLYKQFNDSIFNDESAKKTAEMSARYESERKESQIKLMEKDKEKQAEVSAAESKKQQIIIWSVVCGLVLIAVVLLVVFRSLKITRKQKNIIELQKDEVTKQRDIVETQKEEIAHKNKDLTDSINYAQRIQSAILTSEQYLNDMFLPEGQTASHFILYKPKDIVAGDFYWAYKTPDGKAIWLAADSTGHGVPGAFMSMIGNSLLNEIVVEKGIYEPDIILNMMREGIIKTLGQGGGDKKKDGMDAALCCWDKASNKISFAGANNSLWLIRNGEFTEIEPDIQPVGHYTEVIKPFTKKEFHLQSGDALYTFTDGYCDQFGGPKGKKFKYKPFRELLISFQDKSMPEQKQILNKTIDEWKGELEQIDDICVFGVRV